MLSDKDNEITITLAADGAVENTIVMNGGLDTDQQRLPESAVKRARATFFEAGTLGNA
jgi:hypothetical protein